MSTTEPDTTDNSSTDTNSPFRAIVDADVLDTYLDVVGAVVSECILDPTDDGLQVLAVDSTNAFMVDAELPASEFHGYETDGTPIGVNIEDLQTAIGLADGNDALTLELDPDTWKLEVSGSDFEYAIAPYDTETVRDPPEIPDVDVEAEFTLDADHLKRVTDGCDEIGDYVGVDTTDGGAIEFGVSGDVDDLTFTFTPDDKLDGLTADPDTSALYGIEYFGYMVDATAGPIDVVFADSHPIELEFVRRGTEASLMLAPRIENR